jgi:hypothetical protein
MNDSVNITSDLLIYQASDGQIKIDVHLEDESVWLTQEQMAQLFGKAKSTVSEHIRNIFNEGELDENVVVRKFRTTTRHGAMAGKTQSKEIQYYNLDVIISVGYRVKSKQGTRFRIWATQQLKEYIVKGCVFNDERFKSHNSINYFTLLQERIREIRLRLSERFFYQKIKDIYTSNTNYQHDLRQLTSLIKNGDSNA